MCEEASAIVHIGEELNQKNIQRLASLLQLPLGIQENIIGGKQFIYILKKYGKHDRYLFYNGLKTIGRPDLAEYALKIQWLAIDQPIEGLKIEEFSVKTLVKLLKTEFLRDNWFVICTIVPNIDADMPFENKIKSLYQIGYISKDLNRLIQLMSIIKREDIKNKLLQFQKAFSEISERLFKTKLMKEISKLEKEINEWEQFLQRFTKRQKETVRQLEEDDPVKIESIYVDLTIIEGRPSPVNEEDETTYSEIAFLRKNARQFRAASVNITKTLETFALSKAEIWCLIGNPGCGKSFICHITALRFGKGKLRQFTFSVSIPCRHPDWHQMETSRDKTENPVDDEFIQRWLRLSMPVGPTWTKDLAKHLVESNGEGLLIIIDGMDEFVKDIPFQHTLLFLILTRKTLTLSTIIITSRPGAYTTVSRAHTLKIDRFFHVLGFSPENRDRYFKLQLPELAKLQQLQMLLYLHDEINQLSLVPVNASLFAALVRGTDNVVAQKITHLYSELVAYLIRRQLFRMNLMYLVNGKSLFSLHSNVQHCLLRIGELAYLGIYRRELMCTKDILLKVDKVKKTCHCLGLAQEHIKKNNLGGITRVWTFVHLTMQEFVGAFWLYSCSWRDQCLSTRYIVSTNDTFVMFKMSLRFICGLLSDNAKDVLYVLYRYLPPSPISMKDMPMKFQFRYNDSYTNRSTPLPEFMYWLEFTQIFVEINEILFESVYIKEKVNTLFQFLPQDICFYIDKTIPPNEWNCFIRSLPLLHSIHLIYFDARYINIHQFRSLLKYLSYRSPKFLLVKFSHAYFFEVKPYCDLISLKKTLTQTKICLELDSCPYMDFESQGPWPKINSESCALNFQNFRNISLNFTELSPHYSQKISYQIRHADVLYFNSSPNYIEYVGLLQQISAATRLNGLYLYNIPNECVEMLLLHLSKLSNLNEIALHGYYLVSCISLLPALSKVSLKYLSLNLYSSERMKYLYVSNRILKVKSYLTQILESNSTTLKGLELSCIQYIGVDNWSELLIPLNFCTNLVEIQLRHTRLKENSVELWSRLMSNLTSLVYLDMFNVSLSDSAVSSLCSGLLNHHTIRCIKLQCCGLNSNSCEILSLLIPTVKQLKKLDIRDNRVSKPYPKPRKILIQTAELYSVVFEDED